MIKKSELKRFSRFILHSLFSFIITAALALGILLMSVDAEESTRNRIQVSSFYLFIDCITYAGGEREVPLDSGTQHKASGFNLLF